MSNKINFSTIAIEKYKNLKDFEITYGFENTRFGRSLLGLHNNKLCYLEFHDEGKDSTAINSLQKEWPNAVYKEDNPAIKPLAESIFNNTESGMNSNLNILLKGTDFQIAVWKELTNLKLGSTVSYEDIAKAIGKPKAVRAVASAVANNKVAYVIPCHRVIRKSGDIGKYASGVERKKQMLKYENNII